MLMLMYQILLCVANPLYIITIRLQRNSFKGYYMLHEMGRPTIYAYCSVSAMMRACRRSQ